MKHDYRSQFKLFFKTEYFWLFFILIFTLPLVSLSIAYSQGFNWPDEIFQSMELAHYLVTGRGNITWEFSEKARTTLYPQLLSLWLRIVYSFSTDPVVVFYSTRILLSFFFLGGILSIGFYFLKRKIESNLFDELIKYLLFLFIFILFPLNYYFGYRTLAESISTSLALIAIFQIQLRIEENNHKLLGLSFLLGLTYGLRFQMAIFLLMYCLLTIYMLWKLNLYKSMIKFVSGLTLGFIAYLVSDILFFGIPFISSINYFKVTIIDGVGDLWGTSPFSFYFKQYFRYLNGFLFFLIPGLYKSFRNQYPIILGTLFFILVHSMIAHKELRFIYFTFPLILYWIVVGIWTCYLYFKQKYQNNSMFFIVFIIISSLYLQIAVLNKKIQWNFLDDNLQLFLNAVKSGVQGNSLVTIQDTFAWGAGYVYLGKNFQDILYYFDMNQKDMIQKGNILKEFQIQNILIRNTDSDLYCNSFGYCKKRITIGDYSWYSK